MRQRSRSLRLAPALAALVALLAPPAAPVASETAPLPRPGPSAPADPRVAADLFAMPAIAAETRAAVALVAAGELDRAAATLDRLVLRHPDLGALRADRAALAMLEGNPAAALAHLEAAARAGLAGITAFAADPVFAPLAADPDLGPRLATLRPAEPRVPEPPRPAPITAGTAPVAVGNTAWDPATERLVVAFAPPPEPSAPVLPPRPKTAAYELLREHARHGRVAGNHGDLYDNRDRGHSTLDRAAHPQLAHVAYSAPARAADLDYGLNEALRFDLPTIGNSSTALTGGPFWRSLPRHAMTRPDGTGPLRLWQNAAANHLYVYPAHKDFTDEGGDLLPANTPYVLVSRGSSGSDQPFLEALAMILAAFRPVTKARLVEEGLLVSTAQMVFRRSLPNVRSREAYLSGAAHPAAFDAAEINLARMVSLANAITPEAIPAEVRIQVLEEDLGREGVDYFGEGLSEQLFDTPGAIARVWRSKAGRRTMLVSAEASRDPNGHPLEFHWRLLQGDPERVAIEPLGDGARARITLDWHDPFAVSDETPLTTSRVDIGVFASNGMHDSAPAILSWVFPPHEARTWEDGPDGLPRIAAIDHAAGRSAPYADPLLFPRADWHDAYTYAADGTLAGWTRTRGGEVERFDAHGRRLTDGDRAEPVRHLVRPRPDGTLGIDDVTRR